jgi:hypothetical protein
MIDTREWIKIGISVLMSIAIALVVALFINKAWAQMVIPSENAAIRTSVAASGTGTTAAVTATLPATIGRINFLCGVIITVSNANSAGAANATVTGLQASTLNIGVVWNALAGPIPAPIVIPFSPCQPATAPNVAVVVTSPAVGSGATLNTVKIFGYQTLNP